MTCWYERQHAILSEGTYDIRLGQWWLIGQACNDVPNRCAILLVLMSKDAVQVQSFAFIDKQPVNFLPWKLVDFIGSRKRRGVEDCRHISRIIQGVVKRLHWYFILQKKVACFWKDITSTMVGPFLLLEETVICTREEN